MLGTYKHCSERHEAKHNRLLKRLPTSTGFFRRSRWREGHASIHSSEEVDGGPMHTGKREREAGEPTEGPRSKGGKARTEASSAWSLPLLPTECCGVGSCRTRVLPKCMSSVCTALPSCVYEDVTREAHKTTLDHEGTQQRGNGTKKKGKTRRKVEAMKKNGEKRERNSKGVRKAEEPPPFSGRSFSGSCSVHVQRIPLVWLIAPPFTCLLSSALSFIIFPERKTAAPVTSHACKKLLGLLLTRR